MAIAQITRSCSRSSTISKTIQISCHHPKEDLIVEKLKARDPRKAEAIGDLETDHREGAKRLRRVALAVAPLHGFNH